MHRVLTAIACGALAIAIPAAFHAAKPTPTTQPAAPVIVPAPRIVPVPVPTPVYPLRPYPDPRAPHPWRPWLQDFAAVVAGRTGPDGTELACDLPGSQQQKNIASKGLGCCVFRATDHAARWQNVRALMGFPEWMVSKGIEGGGYPSKVDKLIPQIAKDRGLPAPEYLNAEGLDLDLLCAACASGRMPCVTYSKSPTGRYSGQRIAHMVNIVYANQQANNGKGWFVVLDNNYIGEDNYEWMTTAEFTAAYKPGWCLILLAPPPPMPPHN